MLTKGFYWLSLIYSGQGAIHIENQTNWEESVIERYGKYSLYLALIPLLINPILILGLFSLLGLEFYAVSGIFFIIIYVLIILLIISLILGILARNTKEGKIGLFSSLIIGIAYIIFIIILINPPFY